MKKKVYNKIRNLFRKVGIDSKIIKGIIREVNIKYNIESESFMNRILESRKSDDINNINNNNNSFEYIVNLIDMCEEKGVRIEFEDKDINRLYNI